MKTTIKYLAALLISIASFVLNAGDFTLHKAAQSGDLTGVMKLVRKHHENYIRSKSINRWTIFFGNILNLSTSKHFPDVTTYVNTPDNNTNTPLHYVSRRNKCELVRYLVEQCGTNIHAKNNSNLTPLHVAAQYGKLNIVTYFVQQGANIYTKSSWNETPLDLAILYNHTNVITYLNNVNDYYTNRNINVISTPQQDPLTIPHYGLLAIINYNPCDIERFLFDPQHTYTPNIKSLIKQQLNGKDESGVCELVWMYLNLNNKNKDNLKKIIPLNKPNLFGVLTQYKLLRTLDKTGPYQDLCIKNQ